MNRDEWRVVERVFHAALDRPPAQRPAFVAEQCTREEIRAEVEKLLDGASGDNFLTCPALPNARRFIEAAEEWSGDPDLSNASETSEAAEPERLAMVGTNVSHFKILSLIGRGGMGVVFRAQDVKLGRIVALKVLPATTSRDAERRRRFLREARSASALNHPNIVTIYETGSDGQIDFIAMEFIAGKALDEVAYPKLPLFEALEFATQIADALECAHAAGIIHRDLKPSNIMLADNGRVKILDFGLAKLAEPVTAAIENTALSTSTRPLTDEGMIIGTASYMSPEQAEGKAIDARSDIFSFGLLLYEMLAGHRAFERDSKLSTLAAILHEEPPPLNREIPADLRRIVSRCLRKNPAERWQTMAEVKAGLQKIERNWRSNELARKSSIRTKARLPLRSWLIVASIVLAAGALAAFILLRSTDLQPRELVPVRVTSNPPEFPVETFSLSPDGKYLAYSDARGVHVRSIQTADSRLLPDTKGMFAPGPWTADGTRVFLGKHGNSQPTFYSVSVLDGVKHGFGNTLPLPYTDKYIFRYSVRRFQLIGEDGAVYPLPHGGKAQLVASATNRRFLAGVFRDGSGSYWIELFDLNLRRWTELIPPKPLPIFDLAWISERRLVYVQSEPHTADTNLGQWTSILERVVCPAHRSAGRNGWISALPASERTQMGVAYVCFG